MSSKLKKKAKSLGPANMQGVPADELLLAKLVQNAKAFGMKPCRKLMYKNGKKPCAASEATHCCAIGAHQLYLDGQIDYDLDGIIAGNDDDYPSQNVTDFGPFWAGRAFQHAAK